MATADIIYCNQHAKPSVAKCIACAKFMCLDCIMDHQNYNHPSKKLSIITEEYIDRLQGNVENLTERIQELRKEQHSTSYQNRLTQGFEMLEMCKFEIIQLAEKHFEELKEQFVKVMQASGWHAADLQAEAYLLSKIDEYSQLIAELQTSNYRFNEVNEHYLQDDLNIALQTAERKIEQAHRMGAKDFEYPKLQLNEAALLQLGDSLSQLIGFQPPKDLTKRMLKVDLKLHSRENISKCLSGFMESTAVMMMYDTQEKLASKVPFRDFVCPMKAKVTTTPGGKVLVIGGEKMLSDGSIRYNREISMLDSKFRMMKVAGLMKQGRIHHSIVPVLETASSRESVFILGGKNQARLSSLQKFDISVGTSSSLKPFRSVLGGQTGTYLQGRIYYFGGMLEDQLNKQILVYEIATDNWSCTTPFNSLNYLPTINPIVIPINKDNILILGGLRKENNSSQPYSPPYIQHYNIRNNFLPCTFTELAPCGVHSTGGNTEFHEGVFYTLVARRTDNLSCGPSCPEVLRVDCSRQRISTDAFIEL